MSSCQILDRNKIPGPVMTSIDTGRMDQTDVEKSAVAFAKKFSSDPMLLSWFSKKGDMCGPQNACHEDGSLWLDYAVARGADLSVIVNDWDYVFIFKKSA